MSEQAARHAPPGSLLVVDRGTQARTSARRHHSRSAISGLPPSASAIDTCDMTNFPPTAAPASSALAAIQPLSLDECHALLARHRLCTMSLVDGDEPYAVPLFYGFDGTTLHLGLAEGRKTRVLDANSRVCVTVTEVGPGDAWASVMVAGEAEWLEGAERDASVKVLMEHNRRIRAAASVASGSGETMGGQPSAPPRRHAGGRILRVREPRITGRTRR